MTALLTTDQRAAAAELLGLGLLKNATTLSKQAAATGTTPASALQCSQAALALVNAYVALWRDQ